MLRAAFYARFSSDMQNETSLDDQIRKCRQMAEQEGFLVEESLIFTDAAISGHGKDIKKRQGLARLFDAWDGGYIDIVLCTEMSRLGRDAVGGLAVIARLHDGGVHLLTGDGIDSRRTGWMMLAMIRLGLATEEARTLSARVSRSMTGVLERGGLIAPPPIGYALDVNAYRDPNRAAGALWRIDPEKAQVVRDMFTMRAQGMSTYQIARALNDRGVPSARNGRDGLPTVWRAGSVCRILRNAIYKGQFVYGGSSFSVTRSRKTGVPLETKVFDRPHLRIVEDDLWEKCNPPARPRRSRGGAKHLLSGLVSCGQCPAFLNVKINGVHAGLACQHCEQRVRCEEGAPRPMYTSPRAALAALRAVLMDAVSKTGAIEEVRTRLRQRLKSGPAAELQAAQAEVKKLVSAESRLLELAVQPGIGIEVVGAKLSENRAALATAKARLQALSKEAGSLTAAAVERQCAVTAEDLVDRLLAGQPSVLQVRAMLGRLVQSFVYVNCPGKGQAVFEIELVPGALIALAADDKQLDEQSATYQVTTRIDRASKTNVFTQVKRIK